MGRTSDGVRMRWKRLKDDHKDVRYQNPDRMPREKDVRKPRRGRGR